MPIDVISIFRGLTTSLVELYSQIGQSGWSVKKISFDKKEDEYVAVAQDAAGTEISKTGPTEQVAVANLLLAVTRMNHMRTAAQEKVGMWQHHFVDQLQPIAEAYAKAPIYDPKAAAAYKELADDSVRRATVLEKQLHIEKTNNPEPYPDAQTMSDDIHKKRHFEVSTANCEHPLWTPEQNHAFRIVHDVLGHSVSGGDFGWHGENLACAAHFPLLSANAQAALFSECIAQTAYANHYHGFGPQKVALFPEFYEPVQQAEGVSPTFQGVHPSQSVAPVAMPSIKPPGKPQEPAIPEQPQQALGLTSMAGAEVTGAALEPGTTDPNDSWESNVPPLGQNAYLWHGDPLDAGGEQNSLMDNAKLIDTEWSQLKTGEGAPDYDRMKLAIVNAFRAVLLSPQKDLRWNTIHYQDISSVPPGTTDPVAYWDTLEKRRQEWNVKHFGEGARLAHRPYVKLVPDLQSIVYQMNPTAGWEAAKDRAKNMLFDWETEAQNRIVASEQGVPEEKKRNHYEVENEANKDLAKMIKTFVKEYQPKLDFEAAAAPQAEQLFLQPQEKKDKLDRYGAFMGTHLKAIAQISQHADDLLKAALEDVHEHDGSGHHFRATVMHLGVTGVGPKVCSFAWLLLQPMTSQLATIDTHMMDVLGHKYDKEMNNRDYFKFERELKAGRDAAGYGHVPLGAFQWGMWDNKRTGERSHQDHSGLRVLDPVPHDSIDWESKEQSLKGDSWMKQAPEWWRATQPFRDQVGEEWDQGVTGPKNRIPYQTLSSFKGSASPVEWQFSSAAPGSSPAFAEDSFSTFPSAPDLRVPWLVHPQSGERMQGQPGESLMQHARNALNLRTPDIWNQVADAGKE